MSGAGTNLQAVHVGALIGPALPLVAAIVKQDRFTRRSNAMIALAVAAIATVAGLAASGLLGPLNLAVGFVVVYTTAVAFHHGLWKPTGVTRRLQKLTSVRHRSGPRGGAPPARERPVDLARC